MILDLNDLSKSIDSVLKKVFNFQDLFTHKVYQMNLTNLKFTIKYSQTFLTKYDKSLLYNIPINNQTDNFLRAKTPDEIRVNIFKYNLFITNTIFHRTNLSNDLNFCLSND